MIIGEAPGADEARHLKPFVGRAGQEQQAHLIRNSLLQSSFRLANIYPIYQPGNPDPTPEQVAEYTPYLISEIHPTNPSLIVAVGRFAARWFLGEEANLDDVHGIPQRAGSLDPSRSNRAPSHCTILPVIHPASVFYGDPDSQAKSRMLVMWDYSQVAETIKLINSNSPIPYPIDEYAGREIYSDITGKDLSTLLSPAWTHPDEILYLSIDTEDDFSIQVSWKPGTAYTLRLCQPDFQLGVSILQSIINNGIGTGHHKRQLEVITHDADTPRGCLYDTAKCLEVGLDLRRSKMFNTMYNLYLYRVEPRGLKPASYRFCGMRLSPYNDLISDIGKEKQLAYLNRILELSDSWPAPITRQVFENDGTSQLYTPEKISTTVSRIIHDVESGKLDKDGNPTDPYKRWYKIGSKWKIGRELRNPIESVLGPMPFATLNDVPLEDAYRYGCTDADATGRLALKCKIRNEQLGLVQTMSEAMQTIPMFFEMQRNGMYASRAKFEDLAQFCQSRMSSIGTQLSTLYFDCQPFNPNSTPQVGQLLLKRNLKPAKWTKEKLPSASKKSIEQYRYKDPAIGLLFDWKEHEHINSSFCRPFIDTFPDDSSYHDVTSLFRIAHTETRRLASQDPNLLNLPVRTEIGRRVRACFVCRPGEKLLSVDLSQIELRCLAHDSGSRFLISKFLSDADVHAETAVEVFGKPIPPSGPELDKWEIDCRLPAKTTNFGLVYGQQKWGLFDQFRMRGLDQWPMEECERLRLQILRLFGIDNYIKRVVKEARDKGYVLDISGMRHYLPNLYVRDDKLRAEAERQVVSYRIQSMAQWMIQRAMAHILPIIWSMQDAGLNVMPRLQVHDELIFSCDEEIVNMLSELVIDAMVNHCGISLRVPVKAKAHVGDSWNQLK
jgi:uracil-DNA glycosylase family 4